MDRIKLRMLSALLFAVPLIHAAGTITVTPVNESVVIGGTRQYTATVSGMASTTVVWLAGGVIGGNATSGTIDANGLYHAPPVIPGTGNYIPIMAVSPMDSSVNGSTYAVIKSPGPTLTSISPTSAPLGANFTLTCTGAGFVNGSYIWVSGVQYATKFISSTQISAAVAFYSVGNQYVQVVSPNTMFSNMLVLSVTSSTSGGGIGGGNPAVLTASPAAVSVVAGLTQQFSAMLSGVPASGVTWSASAGSITATGLFTAPAAVPAVNPVIVTATSGAQSATAKVTILSNIPPTITTVTPNPVPVGVFSLNVTGTGFTAVSTATLGGAPLAVQFLSATNITASGFNAQAGSANLVVSNGAIASLPYPLQVGVSNPLVTSSAARRFLQQAAFGPTPTDAAHVQSVGIPGWLTEQFNTPPLSNFQGIGNQSGMGIRFLTNAVTQPDQLRQRVAFAWSQIFVTSLNKAIWTSIEAPYQEMLIADAFKNFRQILADVTLSPTMGQFLDMANNGKANAAKTVLPNENYAREIMQLFTIGTYQLNPDGTPMLDANNLRIPTYSQSTISEFARVYTGWTYVPTNGTVPYWPSYINMTGPMVQYPLQHDFGSKTLLNGVVAPANLGMQADLDFALDNIFNHPNVAPFISKQLIQHLVKSNPSPAYVKRVAAVFNDTTNPTGRGDIQAVITAILTDAEARANDAGLLQAANDGHLQEPALFLAGLIRAFGGVNTDQNYFNWDLVQMGEDIDNAPSVFNYYSPGYVIPQSGGLGGPEFQIYTPYSSVYRDNLVASLFSSYSNPVATNGPGTTIDLTPFMSLASNPATLVDALDFTLTAGLMPPGMKQILVTAVTNEAGGTLRRVQTGVYLILASGYYNVWH